MEKNAMIALVYLPYGVSEYVECDRKWRNHFAVQGLHIRCQYDTMTSEARNERTKWDTTGCLHLGPKVRMLQQLLPLEDIRSLMKIAQKLLPFFARTPQVETL